MSFILFLLVFLTCLQSGWGQCNGTPLVIQLELFTKVYIQSPGFQARKYPPNLSCAWRFDRSRNTSEIVHTFHHKGMGTKPDSILLYGGVNDTGKKLIDTTENLSQDSTTRNVVDYSSLFLLFTTDNVESNDGDGFEMYILESQDYSGTDCSTTKQIQPKSTTQYLTSPNFPQKYPTSKTCKWNISTADEVVVKVIFMDVEPNPPTCYDYVTIGDHKRLCADWEYNIDTTYVFNDSCLITFKSDVEVTEQGFVLSYVERYGNTTEEQTSMTTGVKTTTNIELSTTQKSTSNTETTAEELPTSQYSTSITETTTDDSPTTQYSTSNTETTTDKLSPSQYSTSIAQTSTAETETLSTPLPDSRTNIPPGWGQCNGTTLVIQLELFTKVYIQSPGFQAGKYPQNLSCAWRFDCSRNTSEIIYTFHHKGMGTTQDRISLYGGVNDTGIKLIDTTENLSQDSTTRLVVDYSSLFLLFTTDNVESNDGYGVEMYILESQDYSGTDCSTTKHIQPKSTTQYLTSPNFPQKYPTSKICEWNITTADEVVVKVIFMDVEMKTSTTCYDNVTIGDSKRLCADWEYNIDTTYVFNDSFLITFKSDDQTEKNGFVLSYVESKDNTTEEQTSIKPEVETTTNIELSTTQQSNIQQEEETLSTEAMIGIITGAIAVVSCTGVLIGIVSFLILRRSTSGKSPKYTNDSRETIDTQTTEISAPPRWIPMIDTMWKNNYNPPFLEHESH